MKATASYVHFLRLVEAYGRRCELDWFRSHRGRAITRKHIYKPDGLDTYALTEAGEDCLIENGHKARPIGEY